MTRTGVSSMPSRASSPRLASKSRMPSPSSTGAMCSSSSSRSPAARTWRSSVPPPATATFLPPAASLARETARSTPPVTNVKEVPPCRSRTSRSRGGTTNTGARHGGSPAPVKQAPPHPVGAGGGNRLLDDLRVDRPLAPGEAQPLPPAHGVDDPPGHPEEPGPFGTFHPGRHVMRVGRAPRPGVVAVERNGHLGGNFGHSCSYGRVGPGG